jgi:hypothetical protein
MKTHGDPGWESFPSYFDTFIPSVLDILDRSDLKITFFVVGKDAALEKNRDVLKMLVNRGHEIGNHSFNHEPWLHLYPKNDMERDIAEAEKHIERCTGQNPAGFRGPGFSWSLDLLEVLCRRGYLFDASTFPTYLGPLARAYYFRNSDLNNEEKKQRKLLFGGFKEGMRPVKPYQWRFANGSRLLELPVTTIPIIKAPFHLSYLLYLSRFSMILMQFYLKLALSLCRLTNTEPSFLIHPLDLITGSQAPELAFFPGMDLSSNRKIEIFLMVLGELAKHFTLVTMGIHARSILNYSNIRHMNCQTINNW